MKRELYIQIKEFLREVIRGTEFEGHVMTVGGCVRDEFSKMLTSKHPVMAMQLLRETGAMHHVFPELEETYDMTQNEYHFGTVWEHTLKVVSEISMVPEGPSENLLVLRLSALLHDIGKIRCREVAEDGKVHFLQHEQKSHDMIESIMRTLKFTNEEIKEVCFLALHHMDCKSWGNKCEHLHCLSPAKM